MQNSTSNKVLYRKVHVTEMREGMRRAICAVYVKRWKERLCYRKHNGIAQFY